MWPKLSSREKQCLDLLSEGLSASEIAFRLGIKKVTVDLHVGNLKKKLKARTREQAVAMSIRKAEGQFRKALENVPLIGLSLDPDGRVTFANDHFLALTGWGIEEVIGENWFEKFIPPEIVDGLRNVRLGNIKDQEAGRYVRYEHENEILRRDGTRLLVSWFNVLTRDGAGNVSTTTAMGLDVTEQVRTQRALRENEEFFQNTFRASPVAMSVAQVDDGLILDVNEKWVSLFACSRDEAIGKTAAEIGHWADLGARAKMVEHLVRDGTVRDFEASFMTSTGEVKTMIVGGEAIQRAGEPRYVIAFNDITERKRAEDELSKSEERFSKAFTAGPAAASITRMSDGLYHDVNQMFLRLFGCHRSEVIGKTSIEMGFWEDVGQRERFIDLVKRDGSVRDFEAVFVSRHNGRRSVIIAAEVIEIAGDLWILSSILDVTERYAMVRALRESEARFSTAFMASPAAMAITRAEDSLYRDVNAKWLSILGYSRDEVIGKTALDLGVWDDTGRRSEFVDRVTRDRSVVDFEARFVTKDGRRRTVVMSADLLEIGGVPSVLAAFYDITERKEMERSLSESIGRFSKIFRANPVAMVISRIDDGLLFDANEAWLAMWGCSRDEVIGKTAAEQGHWADMNRRSEFVECLKRDGRIRDFEACFLTRGRESRAMLLSGEIIDFSGQRTLLIAFYDFTERKRAEAALRASEERRRAILQAAMDGFWLADTQGRLLEVNEAYSRMSGYTESELLTMHISDLEVIESKADVEARMQTIIKRGQERFVSRHRRKDGSLFDVEVSVRYRPCEDGQFVAFLRDVSEERPLGQEAT